MKSNQSNSRRRRTWLPYAGAVVLVCLIALGLWPKPVPVETALAEEGAVRATVNEEGKTRIKHRYLVSAPVTGQLRRIPFKVGFPVKAGETVLAVIDPIQPTPLDPRARAQAQARREAAVANLEKAKANLLYAQSELRRNEALFRDKTVSAQVLEAAQLQETSTRKEVSAAESALRQAEVDLAEFAAPGAPVFDRVPYELKSPVSGRVLRLFEESSRPVTVGTPLVEVGDPLDLEVIIEVLSRDGAAISPGAKVEFDQWGGEKPLLGKVRLTEPSAFTKISALGVEEQRVYVVADLVTPPEERPTVGDNYRVEAHVIVWEAENALKVPVGALFRQGEEWATFVVANGLAQLRQVKVGRSSGTETQITHGLKKGEEVILYPGNRVKNNQRVRVIKL
jgi:HlyD family secretion protein